MLTADQMARCDRYTIDELGIAGIDLMERAALACTEVLLPELTPESKVAVVAGAGNNGGDGLAMARLLTTRGYKVQTFLMVPSEKLKGEAATNLTKLRTIDDSIEEVGEDLSLPQDLHWIVDAIFGTGLNRPAEGRYAKAIEVINRHPANVLSVDIPSGLTGSRGTVPGAAVKADITVSIQALKYPHAITPACLLCGKVVVPDIGIRAPETMILNAHLLVAEDYARPSRETVGHKGTYGSLAVIGGFAGMEGAGNLAARAALRFGAGKVRVLTNGSAGRFHHDSVMTGAISSVKDLSDYDAVVVGPGLSRESGAFAHLDSCDLSEHSAVWDADGLYYLAERPRLKRGRNWVLTPHPGEAAMLLNTQPATIQADRVSAIEELGRTFPEAWILLKGYRSLIRSTQGDLYVCGTGNAALATAGSGDVLSGMIGALMAQGWPLCDAVLSACIRHGMAADRWVGQYRDHAMLAEDIIEDLKY